MHGVKRLFSWMIPRFDRRPVQRLARQPAQEGPLGGDARGAGRRHHLPASGRNSIRSTLPRPAADHRSPSRSTSCTCTATARRRSAGWPAALRGIPAILHEHANLTDTPWFQKVADRLLEPFTDIAIAVSKSTADFVIDARLVPASKVKVVYLGVPLEEFSRAAIADEIAAARAASSASRPGEFAIGTVTRLHDSKGNSYLVDAAARVVRERPQARFFLVGEGPLLADLQAQARALGLGDRFVFAGFRRDVAATLSAFDLSVFPVAVGRHADHRVRGAGDGEADRRHRRRRPARHPDRRPRRGDRAEARRRRARGEDRVGHGSARPSARGSRRSGARRPAGSTTSPRSSGRWSGSTRCFTSVPATASPRGLLQADLSFLTSGTYQA